MGMNCVQHNEKEAGVLCRDCGRPLCPDDGIEVGGDYFCRACLEKRVSTGIPEVEKQLPARNVSRFWAFVFSLLPGAGYMYLGLMRRGLETLVLFFGSMFVAAFSHFDELMVFVLPVLFFYTIFDTQQLATKIKEGYPVGDHPLFTWDKLGDRNTILAYVLIGVGALALLNNTLPWLFRYYGVFDRIVPPLLILGLGIFILYRNLRKEDLTNGTNESQDR